MGRKRSLSPTKRAMIFTLFNVAKLSKHEISRRLSIDRTTVRRTIDRYTQTGSFLDRNRSGRPSKLKIRDDRRLLRLVEQNRRKSIPELRDDLSSGGATLVHRSTISRRLNKLGKY